MGRMSSTKVQYGNRGQFQYKITSHGVYSSSVTLALRELTRTHTSAPTHTNAFASDSHNTSRLKGGLRSQSHKRITFKEGISKLTQFLRSHQTEGGCQIGIFNIPDRKFPVFNTTVHTSYVRYLASYHTVPSVVFFSSRKVQGQVSLGRHLYHPIDVASRGLGVTLSSVKKGLKPLLESLCFWHFPRIRFRSI